MPRPKLVRKKRRSTRRRHERFKSALHLTRPLLFITIAKQCGRQTLYRRLRKRERPRGPLWCELSEGQEQLIALYARQERYSGQPGRSMNRVTLHRHVAQFVRRGWLKVFNRPVQDPDSGRWIQLPNRYELTDVGIRWIKKFWKGARVPLVTTDV